MDISDTYYTDGSAREGCYDGGAGAALINNEDGTVIWQQLQPCGRHCSSYDAECVALTLALQHIIAMERRTALICTDSLSLVECLMGDVSMNDHEHRDTIKPLCRHVPGEVRLEWVPSHCGVQGNERADDLANRATPANQEGIPSAMDSMKALCKRRTWRREHPRAIQVFGEHDGPTKEERDWPLEVQTTFSQLRCGHSPKLPEYRHKINEDMSPACELCTEEDGTIEHLLCQCPALEMKRQEVFESLPTLTALRDEVVAVRKLLGTVYPELA